MIAFPKRYADFVARLRVPSGFLIVAVFAWFSHPSAGSLALGLPVPLLGLGVARLGGRMPGQEPARPRAALCLYAQPALHRNAAGGRGSGDSGPEPRPGHPFRGRLPDGLFACYPTGRTALTAAVSRNMRPMPGGFRRCGRAGGRHPHGKSNPFRMGLYLKNQEFQAGAGFYGRGVVSALEVCWDSLSTWVDGLHQR